MRWIALIVVMLAGCAGTVPADEVSDDAVEQAWFPNVAVSEADTPGVIEMEHIGGDCLDVADFSFRLDGEEVAPTSPDGEVAEMFCVGDRMHLDGSDEGQHELIVVHVPSSATVYKKTIQL